MCKYIFSILILALLHCSNAQFHSNLLFLNKSIEKVQSNQKNGVKIVSEDCSIQLNLYVNKLKESLDKLKIYQNDWAWQIFDSSGKINSGLLTGNMVDFGNFDECLAVDVTVEETRIRGKYCYAGINIPIGLLESVYLNVPFNESLSKVVTDRPSLYSVSICIPDACTPEELAEELIGIQELGYSDMCQTVEIHDEFDASDWSFIAFMIIIATLVISSTAYDLYLHHYNNGKSPIHPITLAFSFYTNGKKVFHTSNNPEQLNSLNGVRVFSILWVIVGHRYSTSISMPHVNMLEIMEWAQKPYSQYIQAAPVAVDTFLFMSGVVMAYSFIKSQSKPNARFNIFLFYLHRYLRLTPALAVLWFFYITINKHVTSGPLWPLAIDMEQSTCTKYWYSFFLYIQNYVNGDEMCLGHTWYLSVDIQIFLISPLILLPMVKYPKHSLSVLIGLIVVSVIPPIAIIYNNDITPDTNDYISKYYIQPYNRISPWLVGVLLGAVLLKVKNKKVKIPKWMNLSIWIIVLTMMTLIIYIGHEVNNGEHLFNFALYSGIYRMFWVVGVMWIVFACQMGYGGFINWLLTMPVFQVIARLSYSMYLIHIPILLISSLRKRTPQIWDDYELLSQSFGDIIIVTFLSLFWCLLFESPMVVIEKMIFAGSKADKKSIDKVNTPIEPQPCTATQE